jgi:hypothetical protein
MVSTLSRLGSLGFLAGKLTVIAPWSCDNLLKVWVTTLLLASHFERPPPLYKVNKLAIITMKMRMVREMIVAVSCCCGEDGDDCRRISRLRWLS